MRYAAEHNEQTRERILQAASRLFREQGIAAVGLAKIMADAGLTVGTFYTHFASKEALPPVPRLVKRSDKFAIQLANIMAERQLPPAMRRRHNPIPYPPPIASAV